MIKRIRLFFIGSILIYSCSQYKDEAKRFDRIPSSISGIDFINQIENTPDLNILNYMYFNNGGGVAVEDFNGDGLMDIFFTSNQEKNRLYLNQGNFKFIDITEQAKVAGPSESWTTGVTTADVNGDGKMDIYVSMLGRHLGIFGSNMLYINQGNDGNGFPSFKEESAKYGLNLVGFSTQAVFFDYDLDGDLDMFQLNTSVHSNGTFVKKSQAKEGHPYSGDKLMKNEGGVFSDVSSVSGIENSQLGYGLGVSVSDINLDGYPDLYVANDFHEDDYLYINNGDGTFSESLQDQTRLTSRYSMGNDIADVNNDGYPDIITVDMLPSDYQVLKASQTEDNYEIFEMKKGLGFGYQYSRNTLQLNNGNGTFSEIGLYAGVEATDWSWSPLIADFDLDGKVEIFISNGIVKRPNDMDYLKYTIDEQDRIMRAKVGSTRLEDLQIIELMPELKISNVMFKSNKDLIYQNVTEKWGLDDLSYSSGTAYADFDNDGDLDLIVSNTNQEAFLYRNNTIEANLATQFVAITLNYKESNRFGVGSKVRLTLSDGQVLMKEIYATRGFQSSVPFRLNFGIPADLTIKEARITWPDRSQQSVELKVNEINQVNWEATNAFVEHKMEAQLFTSVDSVTGFNPIHKENTYFHEFTREALILHSQSSEGPAVAIGDVDGNGLDDFYLGGGKGQSSQLFLQKENGFEYSDQEIFDRDKLQEEVDAEWVDIDNDGDLDLAVLPGGNEFWKEEKARMPKLYINDNGSFSREEITFNGIKLNGGAIAFNDINGDGFVDAFVGARSIPWKYGLFPDSYLLINDGKGNLLIDTNISEDMQDLGMVRDAAWGDIDGNGHNDLVIVGDWFPITIFTSDGKTLSKADTDEFGLDNTHGYWSALELEDVNKDGRLDIIAGNLGTNTKIEAPKDFPINMYIDDFDDNDQIEHLIYTCREGAYKLFPTKDELTGQLNVIKKKFTSYQEYSRAEQSEIISKDWLRDAVKREIHELKSCVFLNRKNGFEKIPLPMEAQFSPIFDMEMIDVNNDGLLDIISGGNLYEVTTQIGKYDGSYGNCFINNGDGTFYTLKNHISGLKVKGQVRKIDVLAYQGKKLLVFARNNDTVQYIELKE